jgi:hypothetical protein
MTILFYPSCVHLLRAATLILCATLTPVLMAEPRSEVLTTQPIRAAGDWDYRVDQEGHLWVAFYDDARKLQLRQPDGALVSPGPEDGDQAPSGLAMAGLRSGVALLWRDKIPVKGLFLARTDRPKEPGLELGGDTEPLARFHATRVDDELHVLWYGEKRETDSEELYNLYYRSINLADQAMKPIQKVLPGIYPVWTTSNDGLMVFSWSAVNQKIQARFKSRDADEFGDIRVVAEGVREISPIFKAFRSGQRWFTVCLAMPGTTQKAFQLEGAYSDNLGATWTRFTLDALNGYDIGHLEVATDDGGHILMAASGLDHTNETPGKENVVLLRSDDRGETWEMAPSLRVDTALTGFHARNPSLAFGPTDGQVLVVWEDWREIRSRLYASLSLDFGKTWTLNSVPLPKEPGANVKLAQGVDALFLDRGRFNLIGEQATDDRLTAKRLVRWEFGIEDLHTLYTNVDDGNDLPQQDSVTTKDAGIESARQDRRSEPAIRERVTAFWEAMKSENYTSAYEFQDPFFRAKTDRSVYLQGMGRIRYHEYKIERVRIAGNRAEVDTTVKASIPPFRAATGEMISRPETEVAFMETWLWVDNDWYREYRAEAQGEIRFTQY